MPIFKSAAREPNFCTPKTSKKCYHNLLLNVALFTILYCTFTTVLKDAPVTVSHAATKRIQCTEIIGFDKSSF